MTNLAERKGAHAERQKASLGGQLLERLKDPNLNRTDQARTFRKICDRLYRRRFSGVGSTAQGFSLTKLDTTTSSISSTALTGWSDFIVLYIRSGLVLLSCLFQSHQHRVPKYIFPYFFSICFKEFVGRRVFSIGAPSASNTE